MVIGAILTLFVIMQLTGRIDWDRIADRAEEGGRTRTDAGAAVS